MKWVEFRAGARGALVGLGYSRATVRTYSEGVAWLAAWASERKIAPEQVTAAHLLEFLGSRPHWSRSTRATFRCSVRAAYKWAVIAGHVTVDPTAAMPAMRKKPPAPRPAAEHAYASALRAASADERLMLRLAAEAGLRRAEVAQVHPRRDLIEDPGGWTLIAHGKGAKDRYVPLSDDLARELRLRGATGYLFPGQIDGHLGPKTIGNRISALLPPGVTMHALRHRFASIAYERSGGNLFAVQQLLGHASASTTQMYVLVGAATRRQVVDAVAEVSPASQQQGSWGGYGRVLAGQ
ncbi:integrase [Sphaerisporangium cinnabarinum]|nr:tyrosine-type recombinase/integrase [Sphaerisporangium cinnabarinum]PTU56419.1 integrase [Sphaerisporangium cinnabarinum]